MPFGEKEDTANNKEVVTRRPDPPRDAEVLPRNNKQPDKQPKAAEKPVTTERPTAKQEEKLHTKEPLTGRSPNTTVTVGRSFGSPMPTVSGGIGVGNSGASAGPNGVPGGRSMGGASR